MTLEARSRRRNCSNCSSIWWSPWLDGPLDNVYAPTGWLDVPRSATRCTCTRALVDTRYAPPTPGQHSPACTAHARSALASMQRRLVRTCERSGAGTSLPVERDAAWICAPVLGMLSARPGA